MPEIEKAYPMIFDEQTEQEKQLKQQKVSELRFIAFAQQFNQKFNEGSVKTK